IFQDLQQKKQKQKQKKTNSTKEDTFRAKMSFERAYNTFNISNGTDLAIGFTSSTVAVLLFGTNFVPVKKYDTGDGKLIYIFIFITFASRNNISSANANVSIDRFISINIVWSVNASEDTSDVSWVTSLSPVKKKIVGCSLAVVAGILYGTSFVPVLYIKDHGRRNETIYATASQFGKG
ncbi:hypothetical protein CIB84_002741, partial [Bambusicola thoracicus]